MKILSTAFLCVLFAFHASPAGAIVIGALDMLDCDTTAIPGSQGVNNLLRNVQAVTDGMFQTVARLKVNHDGEGTIGVQYQNGQPVSVRLQYVTRQGTPVSLVRSLADLENGQPLVFQNAAVPGPAIILEGGSSFRQGNTFNFNIRLRTRLDPEQHSSHQIQLDASPNAPRLLTSGRAFNQIVISPGITLIPPSWNGTFTGVQFR